MVASGLKRNLREDQREHLFSLYRGVCDAGNFMTAEEALGLVSNLCQQRLQSLDHFETVVFYAII